MAHSDEELDEARRRRTETSDQLLASDSSKKLVVAGPGTGKTHNFKRVLEKAGGGLALTFIRALARDLERDLGELAQVNTFHGYCKHVAHKLGGVQGLTEQFDYYPSLPTLVVEDLHACGQPSVTAAAIETAQRYMDDGEGLITAALAIGDYYDAVGHTDVVYRVQRHFGSRPQDIPEHPVVVVDEYQDFNLLETALIDSLAERSPVLIAGDDDQALYGFKDASAQYIRELAQREDVDRFDLPYCSRCTEVVVNGVNRIVDAAQAGGNLAGRVDREYLCYLPDKAQDSDDHPALIHAACSVENNRSPYMRRYVAEEVRAIPEEDIRASREGGHATALVIGRLHFVTPIYEHLKTEFPNVYLQRSEPSVIDALDGYERVARNPNSRLGWRILLHVDPCDGVAGLLEAAHGHDRELGDLLPVEYRERHLEVAALVAKLLNEDELSEDDLQRLTAALDMDVESIKNALALDPDEEPEDGDPEDPDSPKIVCTSLVGAKGLSAEHVFIVGFIDGEFPRDPSAIADDEICELIVGLSRTRKACHLVSCGNWAGNWCKPSSFLRWFGDLPIEQRAIRKAYWQ